MPELPEVETLCRQLQPLITNKKILGFEILDSKLGTILGLTGKKITSLFRQGKALKILLENDINLILHLRMTGRLLWQSGYQELPLHTRFIATFARNRLLCIDPRRFATLTLQKNTRSEALINDPLREDQMSRLWEVSRSKKLPIKSFLMDQRIIAGIGNIYACEILYDASINPWRQTCNMSRREWEGIAAVTKDILIRAVACRGTSVSDWRDLFGNKGEYQHALKVYNREGSKCLRCHDTIQRLRLNGRGTYFCPSCQV